MISVIIRSMNRIKLLKRSIQSVQTQNYPSIQLIIVNDSDDKLDETLLKDFNKPIEKISVIDNNGEHGRSFAANIGLENAEGQYVMFLDEDDWIYPDHIYKLIEKLESDSKCHVVYTGIELRNHKGDVISISDDDWEKARLRVMNYLPIHAVVFRRESFLTCRFDTTLTLMEDWDFWLQLSQKYDFCHVKGISGVYELGDGESGLSEHRDNKTVIHAHSQVLAKWLPSFDAQSLSESIFWFDTAMNYYRNEIDSIHIHYKAQFNEFSALNNQIASLSHDYTILAQNFETLQDAHILLHIQHESILNSESWKITAPLRYLGENVRKSVSILVFALKTIRYLYKNPTIILRAFNELRYSGIQKTWLKIRNKSKKIEGFIASQEHSNLFNNIVDQFHDVPFIPQFAINKPIDIIIPVYNGKEFLLPLFESIIRNTSMPYRLFVADDKSSDRDILPLLYEIQKKHPFISMTIIENEMNLGFIKTVNILSKVCENHFVLLNTDTEVPPQWIERLMYPIFKMEGIASTTPFTNSGTICSFPNYLEDNPIFEGLSVEEVDKQFRYVNFEKTYITIPTGVGFCMGVNKNLVDQIGMFDEIYGKGYSEENDWCQRAIQHGYKNIHVTNLFVYHKHGGSFGSEEKQILQRKNLEILLSRYPHYANDVDLTVNTNALREVRELLKKRLIRDKHESSLSLSTKVGRDSIKVYYIGYLSSSSGVGRASLGYIQTLHALGFDVIPFDLVSPDWTNRLVANIYDDLPSFVIYHFNANELLTLDKTFLKLIKKLSYVIGIWAWESDHPHIDFKNASVYVDQVWAISHYMLDALHEVSCRTNVLLHIIEDQSQSAFDVNNTVDKIRSEYAFVVGYMFDLNSYTFRKNPLGVIEAFNKAFHDTDNAALILKISGSKHHPIEFKQIFEISKEHPHIYIIDTFWSDKEISFFYRSIDVYLALFRAEGFGLTIAEAMAHGVPVICTRYSGVLDYIGDSVISIDYKWIEIPENWGPYQRGWRWADPDIDQASSALQNLFNDSLLRESYRIKGLSQITDTLSINVIGAKMLGMFIDAKISLSQSPTI